jgi:hypothetical protein
LIHYVINDWKSLVVIDNAVVAICKSHTKAEASVKELQHESMQLNAVIIYDTFDLAVKAKGMLKRGRTDEPTHWNVKPWRADVLRLPPAVDVALTEAADAHLMLLAVRQVQSFLPWLMDWLERWATCRQFKEAALAVWDAGDNNTRSARATLELSQFAGRHGLSLIFSDKTLVEDKSRMDASGLHQREVFLTPTLQHILEQPVRNDYQYWGINE